MGEAKRRAKAFPYAKTTPRQVLRRFEEMAAALPPVPMNGANLIEMSPADFDRFCARTECSPFDGRSFFSGFRVDRNATLPDGTFIGRRNGKAVWSNHGALQAVIDADGLPAT